MKQVKLTGQPSGPPERPTTTSVDQNRLDEIRALDDTTFLLQIINLYLAETPGLVEELMAANMELSTERLLIASHSIKSSSANLGAYVLADLCRKIETGCRKKTITLPTLLVDEVIAAFSTVRASFERELSMSAKQS